MKRDDAFCLIGIVLVIISLHLYVHSAPSEEVMTIGTLSSEFDGIRETLEGTGFACRSFSYDSMGFKRNDEYIIVYNKVLREPHIDSVLVALGLKTLEEVRGR